MSVNGWGAGDHKGRGCAASVNTSQAGAPRQVVAEGAARSPLARRQRSPPAAAGDGGALMRDGVGTSPRGDGVAHLDQKAGCGSLPEASRSRPHTPWGGAAAQTGAPHDHGVAHGAHTRPRRSVRGRARGRPCGDGHGGWGHDAGRARSRSASGRWECLPCCRRI